MQTALRDNKWTRIGDELMVKTDQSPADDSAVFESCIGDKTVVEAVLQAVGAVTNTRLSLTQAGLVRADGGNEPIPPLYDAVDPDALTRLVTESTADVEVTFSYAGCTVTVTSADTVVVREQAPSPDTGDGGRAL